MEWIYEKNLSKSEIVSLIESWIFNQRDRRLLYRRLIDGVKIEELAYEFELSVSQVKRILKSGNARLVSQCW